MISELSHNQLEKLSTALNDHLKHSGGITDFIENLNSLHNDYVLLLMNDTEQITPKTSLMLMDLQEMINILKSATKV